jgi:hypothetical protein
MQTREPLQHTLVRDVDPRKLVRMRSPCNRIDT